MPCSIQIPLFCVYSRWIFSECEKPSHFLKQLSLTFHLGLFAEIISMSFFSTKKFLHDEGLIPPQIFLFCRGDSEIFIYQLPVFGSFS